MSAATALMGDIEIEDATNREYGKVTKVQWSDVIPAFTLSKWQEDAALRLLNLTSLPSNWDSYGSPPLLNKVVEISLNLLLDIPFTNLTVPNIIPVSGGGVQIEWSMDNRELELEILPIGRIEFLKIKNGRSFEEGEATSPIKINSLLVWLLKGNPYG